MLTSLWNQFGIKKEEDSSDDDDDMDMNEPLIVYSDYGDLVLMN